MFKNGKIIFVSSVTVVGLVIGFLIWKGIIAINDDINSNIDQIKDLKITQRAFELKEATIDQEFESYNFSKRKFDSINNYFIYESDNDDTEFTAFFRQLDNTALLSTGQDKNLIIDLYQSASVAEKNTKKTAGKSGQAGKVAEESRLLRLTLKSDFSGLLKFISYLDSFPYYVNIESVNINFTGEKKNSGIFSDKNISNLQSSIIIRVYKKTTMSEL